MRLRTIWMSLITVLLAPCIAYGQARSAEPESAVAKRTTSVITDGILAVVETSRQARGGLAVVSADGRYAAFASAKRLVVTELATGRVLLESDLKFNPNRMAISPDGQRLTTAGQLWHVPTKTVVPASLPFDARDLVFSPNGARLAFSNLSEIVVVDCQSGRKLGQFRSGSGPNAPLINRLAFSPDGRALFAVVGNGDIVRLNAETLQPLGDPWLGLGVGFTQTAFSPDGRRFAVTRQLQGTQQVVLIETATGTLLADPTVDHGNDVIQAVTFTSDGRYLLTASLTGIVVLWDSTTSERLARVMSSSEGLWGAHFTRDATRLYAFERSNSVFYSRDISIRPDVSPQPRVAPQTLARVALPSGSNVRDLIAELHLGASSATFHGNSSLLVVGHNRLTFLTGDKNWSTSEEIPTGNNELANIVDVAVSRDGRRATVAPDHAAMRVYDVATGNRVSIVSDSIKYSGKHGRPHVFLPNGTLAVPWEQGIRIVDAEKGTTLRRLSYASDGPISVLAAGTGVPWIAMGTSEGSLFLARTGTSEAPKVMKQIHKGAVISAAFSPDDRVLATGGIDARIRLFEADTGNPIGTAWTAHAAVNALAFSPDGRHVASGSSDGTVRVWSVRTGQPITHVLAGHADLILAIMFDPSTGQLLSFGHDSKLRRWSIPLE